ncbi:hypothetical protein NQ318_016428, partial [Aromia moschata]
VKIHNECMNNYCTLQDTYCLGLHRQIYIHGGDDFNWNIFASGVGCIELKRDDDTKLNLLLALEENPITPARQLARDSNLNHKTVLKILKYEKKRPYKMQAVQELLEDDPDRRFQERGHVRQLKKNLPNKLSDDQKLDVMLMLEENPHTSSRQTASALNINHSSIIRVLTENQMHPYKLVPTNELVEDDFDRRILFCEQMMQMFYFRMNLHLHFTAIENSHWMRELHTQIPEKVNVWAGIIEENIIGPFFIDGNLNEETYLTLLQNNILRYCQDAGGMHFEQMLH